MEDPEDGNGDPRYFVVLNALTLLGNEARPQYHMGCNCVIINQNGSNRISQYHIGCDIVIFDKNC